jgi:hypothetical protein
MVKYLYVWSIVKLNNDVANGELFATAPLNGRNSLFIAHKQVEFARRAYISSCGVLENLVVTQVAKKSPIFYEPYGSFRVHKSPPLVLFRSQMNPDHIIMYYLRYCIILFLHQCLRLSSDLFSFRFFGPELFMRVSHLIACYMLRASNPR